jgi:hypothetical protein
MSYNSTKTWPQTQLRLPRCTDFLLTAITNYKYKLALGLPIWKYPFEIIDKLTPLLEFCKFVRKLQCLIMHCHFGNVAREKGAFIENWNNRTYDSASHYCKQLANFLLSAMWMTAIRQAEISFLHIAVYLMLSCFLDCSISLNVFLIPKLKLLTLG